MFTRSSLSIVAILAFSSSFQTTYADLGGGQDGTGACCIDAAICENISPELCVEFGGLYLGDGTDCLTTVCPETNTGACCHGNLCTQETLENCELSGGDFLTYSLSCDPNPCVPFVEGACCIGDACLKLSEETCSELGAVFLGELNCADASCEIDIGICCLDNSVCLAISLEDCEASQGAFIQDTTGEGCARDDIPCADGFQCPDGYLPDCNGNCFPVEWLGDGVCDNNELVFGKAIHLGCAEFEFDLGDCVNPDTSGACCLHVGCLTLSHEDCLASGGQFLGTTYLCADSPCGPALQGDFNNNREIDIEDLLATIAGYGQCDPDSPLPCNGDANLDGEVNIEDILQAISKWGFVLPFYVTPEVVIQLDSEGKAEVPDLSNLTLGYVQVNPGEPVEIVQDPPANTQYYNCGDVSGSVIINQGGESHHRDVNFRIVDLEPAFIQSDFEYTDPGALCHDYVHGLNDIDSEQPVIRVCSGVRINPTAQDNVDPNPLLRVYVDGTEVFPGHEINDPGHYIIQFSSEDNSGNT
ncbi:MAG: hypothetical protein VX527_00800, partial [Planctomycetota bacterium]|nr:hypothetical protein [Planctomycetota bacterium]